MNSALCCTFKRRLLKSAFPLALFLCALTARAQPLRLGDLDGDGQPTVLDIVRLIAHLTGAQTLSPALAPFADLNEDGVVNQSDVDILQSAILGQRTLPNPYSAPIVSAPVGSTNGQNILLTGIARPNRTIVVSGGQETVFGQADSNGLFSVNVTLQSNRVNSLFVTASNGTFTSGIPQPLKIIQDSQPPSVFIDFPTNAQSLTTSNTVVAGRVGDLLSGFMGLSVTLSNYSAGSTSAPALRFSAGANVNVGIGNNGTFERTVPLGPGTNLITVIATDVHGNRAVKTTTVVYQPPLPNQPRLVVVSGDLQINNIHRTLFQPIVVKALQADGVTPFGHKVINLQVTRSDGRLFPTDPDQLAGNITSHADYNFNGTMFLQLWTDNQGEASAWWTLGGDAGCENNRVCVSSPGIPENAYFCATAMAAPAAQINVGSGDNQKVEVGSFPAEPLRAWVNDSCNGVGNVPVTFQVVQGGGLLFAPADRAPPGEGRTSITILSSITGHAEVLFQLGPVQGPNVIEATYPGNPGSPATFTCYGVDRNPALPTTLVGLVLNNSSQPIGGALCELFVPGNSTPVAMTFSDVQGHFSITNPPPGAADLFVYGPSATTVAGVDVLPNSFPFLSFSMTIIPNAENSLPRPVLLPRLNPDNEHLYYGTNDFVLTCEGIAGLKMTIKANSMRDARGIP